MFNKLRSIKKENDTVVSYQVERMPDFFDNIEKITKGFEPLFGTLGKSENREAFLGLITIMDKCVEFCIEAEKIRAKSWYEQSDVDDYWWANLRKNHNLDKE